MRRLSAVLVLCLAVLPCLLAGCAYLRPLWEAPPQTPQQAAAGVQPSDPIDGLLWTGESVAALTGLPVVGLGLSLWRQLRQRNRLQRQERSLAATVMSVQQLRQDPHVRRQWAAQIQESARQLGVTPQELTAQIDEIKTRHGIASVDSGACTCPSPAAGAPQA